MIKPSSILEIGTYTGYSAICLAEGLKPGGKLITIDRNEELETKLRSYFSEAGLDKTIELRIGNALQIIPPLNTTFDLVFIDADKENNSTYFDLVIDKVPSGGYILVDNVLWSGKVIDATDKDTLAVTAFNDKVHNDPRVENVLLPIRDGIMIIRKL
jgi:predicted O-methyltransferase YrrM